jgi:hypothetical protein
MAVARTAAKPLRRPAPDRRPPLEVVQQRRRRVRRRRIAPILSGVLVSGSLFLVVVAHAELTQGQVRLSTVEQAVTAAQTAHRQEVLALANLENPARILKEAEHSLHMAPPGSQAQVPYVPLGTPLHAPSVSSATTATSGR